MAALLEVERTEVESVITNPWLTLGCHQGEDPSDTMTLGVSVVIIRPVHSLACCNAVAMFRCWMALVYVVAFVPGFRGLTWTPRVA